MQHARGRRRGAAGAAGAARRRVAGRAAGGVPAGRAHRRGRARSGAGAGQRVPAPARTGANGVRVADPGAARRADRRHHVRHEHHPGAAGAGSVRRSVHALRSGRRLSPGRGGQLPLARRHLSAGANVGVRRAPRRRAGRRPICVRQRRALPEHRGRCARAVAGAARPHPQRRAAGGVGGVGALRHAQGAAVPAHGREDRVGVPPAGRAAARQPPTARSPACGRTAACAPSCSAGSRTSTSSSARAELREEKRR